MPTSEQDAWVATVLGVDPSSQGASAPGQEAAAGGDLGTERAALGKLAESWRVTETKVRGEVDKLKAKLDELYAGDPGAAQMEKDFQVHVDAIFGKFDGSLAKDTAAAAAAQSEAELHAVKTELSKTINEYMSFLEHDSFALMDENPFVDLDIVGTCEGTLKQMLAALA